MNWAKWTSFSKIKKCNQLEEYFIARNEKGHDYFYHYTSLGAINSILGDNTLFFSSVKRFNDKKERGYFNNELNYYYSICFSTGQNENLALWYLYSGTDGKGGRIRFTKSNLMPTE